MEIISSIERRLNSLPNFDFIEDHSNEIENIKNELKTKLTDEDLITINNRLVILEGGLDDLRGNFNEVNIALANRNKEVKVLSSSVEVLKAQVSNLEKDLANSASTKTGIQGKVIAADTSGINDSIRKLQADLSLVTDDCNEFRRYFNEILPKINRYATIKDLQNLQELLLSQLEQARVKSNKLYADKIETQKLQIIRYPN